MNEKSFISIIIPCYNDAEYIEQSVNSALDQDYENIEIIVVDDGSNERTKSILNSLKPRISKLITQENKGAGAARNTGVSEARGEYILVLDSDDYFDSTFCSKAWEILDTQDEVKLVTCYAKRFKDDKIFDIIKPKPGGLREFLMYNHSLGNALFRKKDFEISGGYDEEMDNGFEDWEFFIRLLKEGGRSAVILEPLFHYRQKKESNSTRANKIKYDLLRYIYLKHEELYTRYYEEFINHLLSRLEIVEKAEQKALNSLESKLGKFILSPIRKLKKMISKG